MAASQEQEDPVWNPEMEVQLIEAVRKNRYLWDCKNPNYTKKSLKRWAYDAIAKDLRKKFPLKRKILTTDSLIKKFGNLRTYYRKELKKTSATEFPGGGFEPRWEHFKRLSYLKYDFEEEASDSNLDYYIPSNESQDDQEELTRENQDVILIEDMSNGSISEQMPARAKRKNEEENCAKKRTEKTPDNILLEASSILKSLTEEKEDIEDAYGQYIAHCLRQLPLKKREQTKIEIQQLIFKARFEED